MEYQQDIRKKFFATLDRDRSEFVEDWLVAWAYQEHRKRKGLSYADGSPDDFYDYTGPAELVKWLNWVKADQHRCYFDDAVVGKLIELSRRQDEKILGELSLSFDWDDYDRTIGRYNAQDFVYQNLYPVPERYAVRRILDFGAGYGRQANLWTQQRKDLVYAGMDSLPLSYCLQHLYYSKLSSPLRDYVADSASFKIRDEAGIYHLPTWRCDLLPDAFFDLVVCVQVLQEIDSKLLRFMIDVFRRVLKPGGALYIRDPDQRMRPVHRIDLSKYLPKMDFELEFRPHVVDEQDIHSVPRIWRKIDPEVVSRRRPTTRESVLRIVEEADSRTGGAIRKGYRFIKARKGSS
jgi:SAM-dependent methyltransferase